MNPKNQVTYGMDVELLDVGGKSVWRYRFAGVTPDLLTSIEPPRYVSLERRTETEYVDALENFAWAIRDHIEEMTTASPVNRVAKRLVLLSVNKFVKATQEDLASMAGMTRPTCNRILRALEKDKVIKLARAKAMIVDMDKLRAIAADPDAR